MTRELVVMSCAEREGIEDLLMGMYTGCIESRDQITSDSIGPGAPRCGTDLHTHGVRSMFALAVRSPGTRLGAPV
jgi:hypothetical protein